MLVYTEHEILHRPNPMCIINTKPLFTFSDRRRHHKVDMTCFTTMQYFINVRHILHFTLHHYCTITTSGSLPLPTPPLPIQMTLPLPPLLLPIPLPLLQLPPPIPLSIPIPIPLPIPDAQTLILLLYK